MLERLFSTISVRMSFVSEPAGAEVHYRRYGDSQGDWQLLGTTPIADVRLPRAVLHWRFGKPGHETAERAGDWRLPWPGYTMTRYGVKAEREGRRAAYLRFRKTSS